MSLEKALSLQQIVLETLRKDSNGLTETQTGKSNSADIF